ncbi:MAG: MFS transporter [Planctomycetaceae bacterium]|nr:MFS transporter [Planctomycetaceae bacterium]
MNPGTTTSGGIGGRDHATLRFASIVASYGLGSFAENFFKQAAMLLAVGQGMAYLQGLAAILYSLPYLLLAAAAGWLADRYSKRRVLIAAKCLEVLAMSLAAYGLYSGNWTLIMVMSALMSTHAVIFSPAFNGTLPDLFDRQDMPRANAATKIALIGSILAGVALAGVVLTRSGSEHDARVLIAWMTVAVPLLGLAAAMGAPRRPAADPHKRFPRAGPLSSMRHLMAMRKDRLLAYTVIADTFVWFLGSALIQLTNTLGVQQLQFGEETTGLLVVAELAGFGVGGLLVSFYADGRVWYRLVPLAGVVASAFIGAVWLVPYLPQSWHVWAVVAALGGAGAGGGAILIPAESFIQVRPAAASKGTVIAAANFANFGGILLSGAVANLLDYWFTPAAAFGALALLALVVTAVIGVTMRSLSQQELAEASFDA